MTFHRVQPNGEYVGLKKISLYISVRWSLRRRYLHFPLLGLQTVPRGRNKTVSIRYLANIPEYENYISSIQNLIILSPFPFLFGFLLKITVLIWGWEGRGAISPSCSPHPPPPPPHTHQYISQYLEDNVPMYTHAAMQYK